MKSRTSIIHFRSVVVIGLKRTKENSSLYSTLELLASFEHSSASETNRSRAISLTLLDSRGQRIPLKTSKEPAIEMIIPRDSSFDIPSMFLYNVTDLNLTDLRVFNYHQIQLKEMSSIHIEFHPLKINLSYLFVHHFDPSLRHIDGWKIFSPNNTSEEDHLYRYFLDNEQTDNHQSLIFGVRELNSTELARFSSIEDLLSLTEPVVFTSNYELRLYTSSCLYFDEENQQWKSDGMRVGPETNLFQTQCFSTHI